MSSEIKYARMNYMIHKVTLLSVNVGKTIDHFKTLFGSAIREVIVPDPALQKRGIRWLMFPQTGIQIHVCPPTPGGTRFLAQIDEIIAAENTTPLFNMPIKESHVGVRVPDLTVIVKRVQELPFPYELKKRADGLYQLYLDIDSAIDYFEVDSPQLDLSKINVKVETFGGTSLSPGTSSLATNSSRSSSAYNNKLRQILSRRMRR